MALAVVRYTNNKMQFVPKEKGANIWRAKHGLAKRLSRAQRAYIRRVMEVYLPPETAPPEYKEARAKRTAGQGSQLQIDGTADFWWQK